MSTELQLYDRVQDPIAAIDRMGEWFAKSGMFGCERIEQGKVLAMACMAERKSPVQIAREYYLIEGRLSDRADSMLAKFKAKGGKHRLLARTAEEAAVELTLEGQTFVSRVTFAELTKEPFVFARDGKSFKKNYATPRARMQSLWARAISDGVRTLAPEIVAGIYTEVEIQDDAGTGTQVVTAQEPLDLNKASAAPAKKENVETSASSVESENAAAAQTATKTDSPPTSTSSVESQPQPPAETNRTNATTRLSSSQANGTLPADLAKQLHEIVDPVAPAALAWLVREKHLNPDQSLEHLPEWMAMRIIRNRSGFLRAIASVQ